MKPEIKIQIDEWGRIIIPAEIRNAMGWDKKATLQIIKVENSIVIQPYKDSCTFCGSENEITPFHNKGICVECIKELTK